MNQIETLIHNVSIFRVSVPPPALDSIKMESETYKKFIALMEAETEFYAAVEKLGKASVGELFGIKIYIDETVPANKAKLLLRGVTVGEVFVVTKPEAK